jgi:type IV secretion system protein VirB3
LGFEGYDMTEDTEGLAVDPLFVAATRPPTRWGVPYSALLVNMVLTMEVFLLVKNPLILLLAVPFHGLCVLLCARDIRMFDLVLLWAQTRMPGIAGHLFAWKGNTYSPLVLDLPNARGRRREAPTPCV